MKEVTNFRQEYLWLDSWHGACGLSLIECSGIFQVRTLFYYLYNVPLCYASKPILSTWKKKLTKRKQKISSIFSSPWAKNVVIWTFFFSALRFWWKLELFSVQKPSSVGTLMAAQPFSNRKKALTKQQYSIAYKEVGPFQ